MSDLDSKSRPPAWHLVIAALVSVAVLGAFYAVGLSHFGPEEWDEFGSFVGGAAGVVLTALTFLALLYTIHIQSTELALSREELRLTREELAANREELARSAEALDQQVGAIQIQNFERTLFDSLRFLTDVVSQFVHRSPMEDQPRRGAQAFFAMHQEMAYSTQLGALGTADGDQIGAHEGLNTFLDRVRPLLATYFRTLYNIYRYLDESPYTERVYYNRIIRAQIPDHALAILFYNSLTERGRKFQRYIVRYRILDNLPPEFLLNPMHADVQFPTPAAAALHEEQQPQNA